MDNYGLIRGEDRRDNLGRWVTTYTWEGPPLARVDYRFLPDTADDFFEMGPWLLRVVDREPWTGYAIVENIDRPFAWAYALRHRVCRMWEDFTWRMVQTLIIWGLAKRPEEGAMLTWGLVRERWV